MDTRTLADLKVGESGYVTAIEMDNEKLKHRLIDMGITVGVKISLRRTAPSGDPLEVSLRGYTLSLRINDAKRISLASREDEPAFTAKIAENKKRLSEMANASHEAHKDVQDKQAAEKAMRLTDFVITGGSQLCKVCNSPEEECACKSKRTENEKTELHLALAGNPNSGKTTLFNALTGSKETVGNWPGVTVEKKEGKIRAMSDKNGGKYCTHGHDMTLVDLPGIYSLSPHSMEEIVARRYLTEDKPDAIINIVDATALERNLYLTLQLMELEIPMIIALNMMDEVERKGHSIDCKELSRLLGVPVIPISARTGQGIGSLVEAAQTILHVAHIQHHEGYKIEPDVFYDDFTHILHHKIGDIIEPYALSAKIPLHFAEIKLLESDDIVLEKLSLPDDVKKNVFEIIQDYSESCSNGDTEVLIADSRYSYIERLMAKVYVENNTGKKSTTDKIDRILTNKYLALPIFALIMLVIFTLTFSTVGSWLSGLVGSLIEKTIIPSVGTLFNNIGVAPWLTGLICDGVISGVGGVLTFLPQIAILFLLLSILEDSGYLARIAFIMDSPMKKIGLSGKAIVPMLMGFGCTVPAAMGARTMENIKDKRMTIMLLPFMSCSAKLPVYGLIAGAFFGKGSIFAILGMYLLGILLAILTGVIMKGSVFKDNNANFVIELPPYRVPSVRTTLTHVWERIKHFLVKAGTLILVMSVILWVLTNFSFTFKQVEQSESMLATIGSFIAPIFTPNGFPFWQAVVALLVGLMAKEAVVSSLALFYGFAADAGSAVVFSAMSVDFSTAAALSFLTFVSLYTPCMAATATMAKELGSKKWAAASIAYQILIAYVASTIVYAVARLIVGG